MLLDLWFFRRPSVVRSSFSLGLFRLFCLVLLFFLSFEIVEFCHIVETALNTLSESKICDLHPLARRIAFRQVTQKETLLPGLTLTKDSILRLECTNQNWKKASQYNYILPDDHIWTEILLSLFSFFLSPQSSRTFRSLQDSLHESQRLCTWYKKQDLSVLYPHGPL